MMIFVLKKVQGRIYEWDFNGSIFFMANKKGDDYQSSPIGFMSVIFSFP